MALVGAIIGAAVAVVCTAVNVGVGVHNANEQKAMQKKIAKEQKAARARANFISQQSQAQMPSSMVRTAIRERVAEFQSQQGGGAPPPGGGVPAAADGAPAAPQGASNNVPPGQTSEPAGESSGTGEPQPSLASSDGSVDPSGMPILAGPIANDDDRDDDDAAVPPPTGSQVDPSMSPNQVNYA